MNIKKYTIEDYIKVLSSNASMPGGGLVSAINGAQGISLILMVCNLTLGKEKYKKYEKIVKKTISDCEKLKNKFLELANKDIEEFKNIERVFKMPKTTEAEKKKRAKAMEIACKKCCKVPVQIIECSKKGLSYIENVIDKSNKSAESDLAVAAINLGDAARGALLNILINLKSIKDKKFILSMNKIEKNDIKNIEILEKYIYKKIKDGFK